MKHSTLPRLVVAGLSGDTGKSLVAIGLLRVLRARGLRVAPFKKGPDFIDAAWLGAAAGSPGRNLDTFLMPDNTVLESFFRSGQENDIAIIEGNRGVFDGMDAQGSHSTARLAKLLKAPVILVVNATKVTRTVAALVLGCRTLEPDLDLAGVILNQVGTSRQQDIIRQAVVNETGVPVVGAIPRLKLQHLPSRHLGLVTASEHAGTEEALDSLAEVIGNYVDINTLLETAHRASSLSLEFTPPLSPGSSPHLSPDPRLPLSQVPPAPLSPAYSAPRSQVARHVRIGVLKDKAFSFYYPENLEALEQAGASLTFISPLADETLPDIDALYAGGGFPEVHAGDLSANRPLRQALARRIAEGLPVWAECGGLMYLARTLFQDGVAYPMVGALPLEVEQTARPQGHGYVEARVNQPNPFLPEGLEFRGHEFHYSRLKGPIPEDLHPVFSLSRGTGIGAGRDGIRCASVVAGYTHIHALGMPDWAIGVVEAAARGDPSPMMSPTTPGK